MFFDLLWITTFGITFSLMLLREPKASGPRGAIKMELLEGQQRQGLYRQEKRMGTIQWKVKRRKRGWRIRQNFKIKNERVASFRLDLREDLSLAGLGIWADIGQLGRLTGVSSLFGSLTDGQQIELHGSCAMETGVCSMQGRIGQKPLRQQITAGRGPVVTSAVYPLLARGSLGRKAELTIFDPLSLQQRIVTFTIQKREQLELHGGTYQALRVQRDLSGLNTRVWIDSRGRVLKEELPLGFVTEHESWKEE
jgi:hypothetical protein